MVKEGQNYEGTQKRKIILYRGGEINMRTLTKEDLLEILDRHNHWWNEDCEGWEDMRADLSGTDLRSADLIGVNLRMANLSSTTLCYANLGAADLRGANLSGADLRNAAIRNANLMDANLSGADLSGADLGNSNLRNVNLRTANLRWANLKLADLKWADLRNTNLSETNLQRADLICVDLSGAENILSSIDYLKENFEFTSDGIIAYKTFNGEYTSPEKWIIQSGSIITENCNPNRTDVCGCGINIAPLEWVKTNYNGDIWKVLIRWEWLVGVVVPYNTNGKIRCEKCELVEIVDRKGKLKSK